MHVSAHSLMILLILMRERPLHTKIFNVEIVVSVRLLSIHLAWLIILVFQGHLGRVLMGKRRTLVVKFTIVLAKLRVLIDALYILEIKATTINWIRSIHLGN